MTDVRSTSYHPWMGADEGLKLEGKAVLVRSEGTPHLTLLSDVRFATEQGRRFLVGTVAEGMSESDWSKGHRVAIAWDSVQEVTLVGDVAEFVRKLRSLQKQKRGLFG